MNATEPRRTRLREYLPWMARDYFTNPGPSTAVVMLLVIALTVLPVMAAPAGQGPRPGHFPPEIAARLLQEAIPALVFLGALFATNGMVSNDRKLGYYRFLFAKPVNPPAYYALTFLVYGAGLLVIALLFVGAWSLAVRPMFPAWLFVSVALMYVAYGGIGFLLTATWRFDWISLVSVILIADVGWSIWGKTAGWRHWLLYLLPPVHRTREVYALVNPHAGTAVPWGAMAWLAGYGAACFVIGLVVLRKRPLAIS